MITSFIINLMKFFILILISGLFLIAEAQNDTIWFDKDWKTTAKNDAAYFRLTPKKEGKKFKVIDFYITGEKRFEGSSLENEKMIWDGMTIGFYVHGDTMMKLNYSNGTPEGKLILLDRWGNQMASGLFLKGQLKEYQHLIEKYKGSNWKIKAETAKDTEEWKIFRDNILVMESFYQHGKRTGKWIIYHLNGKGIYATFEHKNDECKITSPGNPLLSFHHLLPGKYYFPENLIEEESECLIGIHKIFDEFDSKSLEINYLNNGETEVIQGGIVEIISRIINPIAYVIPVSPDTEMQKSNQYENIKFDCIKDKGSPHTKCTSSYLGTNIVVYYSKDGKLLNNLSQKETPTENQLILYFESGEPKMFSENVFIVKTGTSLKRKLQLDFIPVQEISKFLAFQLKSENLRLSQIEGALKNELLN